VTGDLERAFGWGKRERALFQGELETMATKLYVGNLPFSTSEQDLHSMFSEVGTVVSAEIVTDRETGRSRGFGFVEMSTQDEATAAVTRFDQMEMKGRPITVNEARPREGRPVRGGSRSASRES
jgi:cold-inducible RNA-binding protein